MVQQFEAIGGNATTFTHREEHFKTIADQLLEKIGEGCESKNKKSV